MAEFGSANQHIGYGDAFVQASSSGFDNSQKAARVAMLKTRFADLISKAQETLGKNEESKDEARTRSENVDVVQNQQKKKRRIESNVTNVKATAIKDMPNSEHKKKLKKERGSASLSLDKDKVNEARMQHEKRDFVEKQQQIKNRRNTTDEAIRNKANSERKKKIEKEREAARYALEKVEASVYVDDFNKTYKDFLMLISS